MQRAVFSVSLLAVCGAFLSAPVSGGEGNLVSGEDGEKAKEALRRKIIEKAAAGASVSFYIDFMGGTSRAGLGGATDEELQVNIGGAPIRMPWDTLSPKRFLGLASKCIDENSAQDHLTLARFALANGMEEKGEELLRKALELDPNVAGAVNPLLAKLRHEEMPVKPQPSEGNDTAKADDTAPAMRKPVPAAPAKGFADKVHGWDPTGLSGGGAMYVPVISRADPNVMMINCDMSGCYVSKDGGRHWKMVHYKQRRSNTRCRPALHPTNPNVILAPGGWGGNNLVLSNDCGETWQGYGNVGGGTYGEILFDPDNPNLVMCGSQDGCAVSKDGGKGWTQCRGPGGQALSFHFDRTSPIEPRTIFAATQRGIWRSDDGGSTWTEKTNGLPWKQLHSFAGASDPKTKRLMLYCSIQSRAQDGKFAGGLYRSRDKGETWESAMGRGTNQETQATGGYADGPIAQYRHVLAADANPMRVYAFNTSTNFWPPGNPTCFRSDDGGNNWRPMWFQDPRFPAFNCEHNYHTASTGQAYQGCPDNAAICPSDPDRIVTVDGMRVFLTYDGGGTWPSGHCLLAPGQKAQPGCSWICNGLVVTTTWHYYVDPFQHNRHYICYTDIGFARSVDNGRTWIWWEKDKWAPWRNTCYELAFDPDIPGKVWGAFSNVHDIPNGNIISGRHGNRGPGGICVSTDFCESWRTSNQGLPEAPATSVVVDPRTQRGARTLYAGVFHNGVYKSTDDGKTWAKTGSGLGHSSNMNVYRVILHKDGTLFALITASIGGFRAEGVGLYRLKEGSENWERITNEPLLLWPKDFAVHPENSSVIFVGAAHAGGGSQEGLWRTKDGGATWQKVGRFGREHFGAYFHPKNSNWVYATMCEGAPDWALWLSTDGGNTWKPFQSFPFGNTQRVTVDPDDPNVIYVTTFGGSVFKGPAVPAQ